MGFICYPGWMCGPSLKKVDQGVLQLLVENKNITDGRTYRQTDQPTCAKQYALSSSKGGIINWAPYGRSHLWQISSPLWYIVKTKNLLTYNLYWILLSDIAMSTRTLEIHEPATSMAYSCLPSQHNVVSHPENTQNSTEVLFGIYIIFIAVFVYSQRLCNMCQREGYHFWWIQYRFL